jgi:hypothetical protein
MHRVFNTDSIIREEEGVHVEAERDGGVAKFANSFQWLKSPRHSNLDDVPSERANVGDNIYVSGSNVSNPIVDSFNRLVDFVNLSLHPLDRAGFALRLEFSQRIEVVLFLLV